MNPEFDPIALLRLAVNIVASDEVTVRTDELEFALDEVDRLTRERDYARDVARRIFGERVSFWRTPGPEYLRRLGLSSLPDWLHGIEAGTDAAGSPEATQ
jgi:hypothetical protein